MISSVYFFSVLVVYLYLLWLTCCIVVVVYRVLVFEQLLLYTCGSKQKYRQLRDGYTFESQLERVQAIAGAVWDQSCVFEQPSRHVLSHDTLISLVGNHHLHTHSSTASCAGV